MGNYCSTSLKKKDLDNTSNKSDESPSYQLNEKNKKNKNFKAAPLADPEPISDVSAQNTLIGSPTGFDQEKKDDRIQQDAPKDTARANSVTTSTHIPVAKSYASHLTPLLGKLDANRPIGKAEKIVLYILSYDSVLKLNGSIKTIYTNLRSYCASRGFELFLSNLHSSEEGANLYDESKWINGPLEAQSGHSLSANCISEITRQSSKCYLIPILCLGNDLGEPLLPLTIESQDFLAALSTAERDNKDNKQLLEKWYTLDNKAQPPCYRLKPIEKDETAELRKLLEVLVNIFSNELKDLYLTTVVEQEINNTVLISQELAKRCIWMQISGDSTRDIQEALVEENARRLTNLTAELKNHLNDKNVTRLVGDEVTDQVLGAVETIIRTHVDVIIEEHLMKSQIPNCTHGIDKALYKELESVNRHSLILSQSCPESKVFGQIKKYIIEPSSKPLVIYGKPGSGKTVLISKLAQNIHDWIPDCCFVLRYAGLTENSMNILSILESIIHQVTHIQSKPLKICNHDAKQYADVLADVIKGSAIPIVITIDSIEFIQRDLNVDWIPADLPDNVKVILTLTSDSEKSEQLLGSLKKKVGENLVCLTSFSDEQWSEIINSGGSDFCAANGALQLPPDWIDSVDKTPIHAKILWWLAWLGIRQVTDTSTENIANHIFHVLETRFSKEIASSVIALMAASRGGLRESEMVDLISILLGSSSVSSVQLWLNFCWIMGPLLLHTKSTYFMDKLLLNLAKRKYENEIKTASRTLRDYLDGQPSIISDASQKHCCPNVRKLNLLPFYAFKTDPKQFSKSRFITDLQWIHNVVDFCGCVSLLKDLDLIEEKEEHIKLLDNLLRTHFVALNYDAKQFYAILQSSLDENRWTNDVVAKWREELKQYHMIGLEEIVHEQSDEEAPDVKYDSIVNLGGKGNFVVSISTSSQELTVWDVVRCKKVRTLKNVPQPTALCPVGDYGVAVLCGREIKVLDLDEGCFKVTLKGVMNQKMPYFGLHDAQHLVCLSRNRMYVNLMNLESGDCVTTFKAGEDRFLNSLLVSGDGRILVCGDETQKPFPLLVWHLSQRKLLYDLRIPHHDFITSLSAITFEGSYVCVVAKELAEPSPNFIVVYDLQSGTLFKKWKPACNTVSLAISQAMTCVIAGLEDARILVWDLVTGNCKLKLLGHTAPVTLLKLDPTGKILLSGDKENQDFSVRIWDLSSGSQLAVYTPSQRITTCEIMSEGRFIILALENRKQLITLELKKLNAKKLDNVETVAYGRAENEGKEFEIVSK